MNEEEPNGDSQLLQIVFGCFFSFFANTAPFYLFFERRSIALYYWPL